MVLERRELVVRQVRQVVVAVAVAVGRELQQGVVAW